LIPTPALAPLRQMLFKLAPELMKRHIQSDAMLHAIGAYSVLCGFASGELGERLGKTTGWLKDWLAQSSSLTFRMQSYKELYRSTRNLTLTLTLSPRSEILTLTLNAIQGAL
jgi:hypothetical protein